MKNHGFALVIVQLIVTLLLLGCDHDRGEVSHDHGGASQANSAERDNTIQPGYGIRSCHIGMPADELLTDWVTPVEPELQGTRTNTRSGISVNLRENKVSSVLFLYVGKSISIFKGGTTLGIAGESSIADVLEKHGDPTYVSRSQQSEFGEFPGAIDLVISYWEKGICFQFLNGRLAHITVIPKRIDIDYRGLRNRHVESDVYIRYPNREKVGDELRSLASDLEKIAH
jgi:hypothetical protein